MKLNELIDEWLKLRDERAALARQDRALAEQISQLQAKIMDVMDAVGTSAAKSPHGTVAMVQKNQPTVTDWQAFYEYVATNDAFDLLQRRLSPPAFRARWDDDVEIPGTTSIPIWSLSLRKST